MPSAGGGAEGRDAEKPAGLTKIRNALSEMYSALIYKPFKQFVERCPVRIGSGRLDEFLEGVNLGIKIVHEMHD